VVIGGSAEIEGMVDRVATEEMEVCPATADMAVVAVMVVVVEIVVANKVPMRKTTKDLHLLNYINLAHFSEL
jgi:diacylglycerol kinase